MEKGDNLYDNAFNLLAVAQKLLNTIITSTKHMPKYVHDTITQMAIGMGSDDVRRCHLIITTFIFVRVICPALVLPQRHGLLPRTCAKLRTHTTQHTLHDAGLINQL